MSNTETKFSEIRKYLVSWVTDVVISDACGYLNINKISEGTALTLLNLIFDLRLEDMNKVKKNFPGIDLGDDTKGLVAYQVTSENSSAKILSSLKTFHEKGYIKKFPNGLRFLIVSNRKERIPKSNYFLKFKDIFDPSRDILYPPDLVKLIEQFFRTDELRFNKIMEFLKSEFEQRNLPSNQKALISFNSPIDKFEFYKKVISGTYHDLAHKFIQFTCQIGQTEVSTEHLALNMEEARGLLILGPSGCGKSSLARRIALKYLNVGITIVVEGKYYEKNLDSLLNREASAFGFDSGSELFHTADILGKNVLVILDGLNECNITKRAQLLAELEKVQNERKAKIIITAQIYEALFESLKLIRVDLDFPSQQTKMLIAKAYSGKYDDAKIESLIRVVSTAIEAKMIGEIGSEQIGNVSRFSLFEEFLSRKLGGIKLDGFFLLSLLAKFLSENISFSLSERRMHEIIRENNIQINVYNACLQTKLLESNFGKVSFSHEMFYNFFVAESVVRFSKDVSEITAGINAPKNHDKKLLIIGSIDDSVTLAAVLSEMTEVELFVSLVFGDGGEMCSSWIKKKIFKLLQKIDEEIMQLEYEMSEKSLFGVSFIKSTLISWTNQELALIRVVPYLLASGQLVKEIFDLTAKLDDRGNQAMKELLEDARRLNRSARYGVFASSYVGLSGPYSAMTLIFSELHNGFINFRKLRSIPDEILEQLLEKRSLKHGQFFFLLLLLQWDDKLQLLYGYVINALTKENWKKMPYHLFNEILENVRYFAADEKQQRNLIDVLNIIHKEIDDVWGATMIIDALSSLGAFEDDTIQYIPVAKDEIESILNFPEREENCSWASAIYDRQFDHSYSYAYNVAINDLDEEKKKIFFKMALKGTDSSFFTTAILIEAAEHLQEETCTLIQKWMEDPKFNKVTPQDSFRVFLLSHLIYAKYNYPIHSRFADTADPLNRSLFATAEIYYWLNRRDLTTEQKKTKTVAATVAFLNHDNQYVIDSLYESRHTISSGDTKLLLEGILINHIEDFFGESCLAVCRFALQQLGSQKGIFDFNREAFNVDRHAVYIVERLGGLIDIELLRTLSDHPILGEAAVNAIKGLSQKSS